MMLVLAFIFRGSKHPLSRSLYQYLDIKEKVSLESFQEITGKGMKAMYNGQEIKLGSASFVGGETLKKEINQTRVYVKIGEKVFGKYIFQNAYRHGVEELFKNLSAEQELMVLSGDNDGEYAYLQTIFPSGTHMHFNQTPSDKLQFIKELQSKGKTVMMVGDGLNDAGA